MTGLPKRSKGTIRGVDVLILYIKYKIAMPTRCPECAKGIHSASHNRSCRHGQSDQSHVSNQSINKSNSITTPSLLAYLSTPHKPIRIPESIHPCGPIISTSLVPYFPTHLPLPSQSIDHRSCECEKAISVSTVLNPFFGTREIEWIR